MLHPKILIIGAGSAGIAAASRLIANNLSNITILEAEDRIGGRVFTSEFGEGTVDLGAQWVHGQVNNVAHALGSAAGLLGDNSYDILKSKCVLSDGSFMEHEASLKLYSLSKEVLHDELNISHFEGSLGDYFNESIKERLKKEKCEVDNDALESFLEWFHKFQNSLDGSDSWFLTSARGTLEYHECEGNLLTRWKTGGYANILNLLMGSNSSKIKEKIVFDKPVKRICWEQQPVEVLCADGQTFTADHVLLTVSLGVLKENISSLFVPKLPSKKISTIQGLGIGTIDKIFIQFPHRWWPIDCTGFSLLWRNNKDSNQSETGPSWLKEVFGFYSVDSNPQVLCGWVGGQAARYMEQCTDEQVQESCYQLLVKFLGSQYNIPSPVCILRSKWHSNPHFRGSYSFRSVTSDKTDVTAADLATPLCLLSGQPVVLFGGEATHDHFYSTVHGAIETGWREADRLLALYRSHQNNNHNASSPVSVIIVGAGMSGLGAAKTLQEAGITDFLILEGQERAGGRVCSVPVNASGQDYVELGAQWIHGEDNPVYRMAVNHRLLSNITSDEGQGLYLKPNGEEVPFSLVQEVAGVVGGILEDCCKFVNEPDAPDSIGEVLSQRFTQYLETCNDQPNVAKDKLDLFDWHLRFQMIDNSCDRLNCLSARSWGLYQYTGGKDYNNFQYGYSSLVHSLTKVLPSGSLRTDTEVTRISCSPGQSRFTVTCNDGSELLADHVIVTSSLGYLKEHHRTLFCPPLPSDITKTIEYMGFDTINKLFLVYDRVWWEDDLQGIQLIWDSRKSTDSDDKNWLRDLSGFDVLPNLKGVLLGWVGGEGAVAMETLSDEEIADQCTVTIRSFLRRNDIPQPDKIFRSKWHSNKFIRGGYSHTTSQCDKESCGPETLSQPIYMSTSNKKQHPMLLLAGEALHRSYFSTTHGAYLSGVSQAQTVLDYIHQNTCQEPCT